MVSRKWKRIAARQHTKALRGRLSKQARHGQRSDSPAVIPRKQPLRCAAGKRIRDTPAAATQPLAESPWEDGNRAGILHRSDGACQRPTVRKSFARAEREHFEPLRRA